MFSLKLWATETVPDVGFNSQSHHDANQTVVGTTKAFMVLFTPVSTSFRKVSIVHHRLNNWNRQIILPSYSQVVPKYTMNVN